MDPGLILIHLLRNLLLVAGAIVGDLAAPPAGSVAAAPAAVRPPEREQVALVLRRARADSSAPAQAFVEELAAAGTVLVPASLEILQRERVPPCEPFDTAQVLSEPQREILLGALGLLPAEPVLRCARARVGTPERLSQRVFLLRVLGVAGGVDALQESVALALRKEETQLDPAAELALRGAIAGILHRHSTGLAILPGVMRACRPELVPALVLGAADCGDPRALALYDDAIALDPALTPLVAAQVRRIGRSPEAWHNSDLAERFREQLDPQSPPLCRALVLALGELRDYESIPALIDLLESDDAGLAGNALWALQRVTGLAFPAAPERWKQWHAQEVAWFRHVEAGVLQDLSARDPVKVSAALRAIARRRTQREDLAQEVLVVLARPEPKLRIQACDTLAALGAELALLPLLERMENDVHACSQAAWRALAAITGRDLPADATAWRVVLEPGA